MNAINIEWPLIFGALFPWACIAVGALITPKLTRPDLFFAVTVQPSFRTSPEGVDILRRYNRFVLAAALVGLLPLVCFKISPSLLLAGMLGPVGVEMVGFTVAFLAARRRTIPHHVEPTLEREAQLTPRTTKLPGGWLAQAGPFLILAAVCGLLAAKWNDIPERMPIHWNAKGLPDGWAAKNWASVFSCAGTGLAMCLLLGGISYAVAHGGRRIHSSGTAGRNEARFVRAILYFVLGTEYWMALLMSLFSLVALRADVRAPLPVFWPIILGQLVVVGAVFVVAWRTGQGGWRLRDGGGNAGGAPIGDRTPDECWKLGLIYFNPNDSALWVEKRFGVGWTLNFANPRSWMVMGAILLFGTVAVGMAMIMGRR